MFTGLITHIGKVKSVDRGSKGAVVSIDCPDQFLDDVAIGDSIAVSGPCLTVTRIDGNGFKADVSPETLDRTTILKWQPGRDVNLEKSLSATGKLGGHFVMGHIDGTARVKKRESLGDCWIYHFETSPDIVKMIVPKGSVSIDGVSLTPSGRSGNIFEIAVIPHTLEKTTLAKISTGDEVNVEIDIFARYVYEFLQKTQEDQKQKADLDLNQLKSEGY